MPSQKPKKEARSQLRLEPRPMLEEVGIGVTTPMAASMMKLLGVDLSHEGVAFTGSESEALKNLYGFYEEPPTDRPPRPVFDPVKYTSIFDSLPEKDAQRKYEEDVRKWERWEDPQPFMQAGADVNLMRHAQNDGLRLIGWLAEHVEPGKDPLKVLVQMAIDSGLDVDPSDVSWVQEEEEIDDG